MKRTYSKEFKMKACELVITDNIAVAVVAEKFGINHVMLHRWVSEYRELGNEAFVGKGHQRQDIVQEAFQMAVGRNPKRPANAVCHSDRGCQYTAKKTKELVEKYGFRKSMSAREPRATINRSRASGTPSNVRCLISGISHSRRQAQC